MLRFHSKLIASILSLVFGAGNVIAAPADPPVEVTRIPVEFSLSVADLEKQLLRGVVQKIDPKAKLELPIVVKANFRDLPKAVDKPANAPPSPNKVVVLPAPPQPPPQPVIQPGRPGLLRRPIGSRVIEKVLLQPALDLIVDTIAQLPNLDYRIELRSLKLTITGQTLTCEIGGGFSTEAKALPAQTTKPLPTVRGDIGLKLTVTKELVWSDSGKLYLIFLYTSKSRHY